MSKKNTIKFISMLGENEAFFNKVKEARNTAELIELAKEFGFEFDAEDIQRLKEKDARKLSEEELNDISAGRGENIFCPRCGSIDLFFHSLIGLWSCNKCRNIWQ